MNKPAQKKPTPDAVTPALEYETVPSGDDFIVVAPDAPAFVRLNRVGLDILSHFNGVNTLEDVAAAVADEYGVPPEMVLPDVLEFYQSMTEVGVIRQKRPKWRLEEAPLGIYLEITRRCNGECAYCYAGCGDDEPSSERMKTLIDSVVEAGAQFIILSGGEPFLRSDILDVLEYSSGRINTSVITNASLIDKEKAEELAALPGVGVRVSLDGATEEVNDANRGKGAFVKTTAGIDALICAGMAKRMSICTVVTAANVFLIADMTRFCIDRGIPSLVVTPAARSGLAKERWDELKPSPDALLDMFRELYRLEKEHRAVLTVSGSMMTAMERALKENAPVVKCPVGVRPAVDVHGDVYPCSMMMDDVFKMGNAFECHIYGILESQKSQGYRQTALCRKDYAGECASCIWRGHCTGGCMARAWMESGRLEAPDPDCGIIKAMLEELLRHY